MLGAGFKPVGELHSQPFDSAFVAYTFPSFFFPFSNIFFLFAQTLAEIHTHTHTSTYIRANSSNTLTGLGRSVIAFRLT